MGIKIMQATENPLTHMGNVASECYKSKGSKQIALSCLKSGHGRVLEYADITLKISGYSARVMRELYTHIVGTSRLQSSTRYVNYDNFEFFTPDSIKEDEDLNGFYNQGMRNIMHVYETLLKKGIPKQDVANILPLGMLTTVVLKINVRALIHMFEERTCNRAYSEFRKLMKEIFNTITSQLDSEWSELANLSFQRKCEKVGYCTEDMSCGYMPKKEDIK